MSGAVNFCGYSGGSFQFTKVGEDSDWVRAPGIVLFAAPEGRSWRIISVAAQSGAEGDVGAFWRWREARRYGATTVFIRRERDSARRQMAVADLNAGLDPVCVAGCEQPRMAA